ncbi:Importin N-terminal domain-containing protein [Heracleum sosnowskyi]|uniref:Importin N-terminal domain-containing protein n=1 Tax=Heracleum sosnowskyi TaxID=360622 RepID=A0AAD8H2I5_9APIA|nr:Importin N-terminal domain-containing protein [Heracleum sosnowskyi]
MTCEASIYALGLILEGPSIEKLSPWLSILLDNLVDAMFASNSHVRDRTAWTLSRVFELLSPAAGHSVITQENLPRVIAALLDDLNDSSHIAEKVYKAIYRLEKTLELKIRSAYDRENQIGLQASLCRVLQVIIQKLGGVEKTNSVILKTVNQIMELFFIVFSYRSSTIHEEALLATGILAHATGLEFFCYMPKFFKYLEIGLKNFEEYQVCSVSVGVVGDIFRASKDRVLPYCEGITTLLVNNLNRDELHHSVKPPIFSCFGDIALAIGEHFEKYFKCVVQMMQRAAKLCKKLDNTDKEMMICDNQPRQSILETYSCILQAFKDTKADLILPYDGDMLLFIKLVSEDRPRATTTKNHKEQLHYLVGSLQYHRVRLLNTTKLLDNYLKYTTKRSLQTYLVFPIIC